MKHTPGKWHVGRGNGEGSVFADKGRMRMENNWITLYPICKVIDFNGEGKDYARLIAASPDLYEALIEIQKGFAAGEIKFTRKRQSDSNPYHKANVLMCKALAKAEGKEV